jgi:long-chain acyl-CoA synthetase
MSIHWPIIKSLLRSPKRVAVVDDFRSYKAAELLVVALHLADEISRLTRSRTVGVMLPTSGLFPAAALAGWMLGKVVVPLNYLLKKEELQFVVDDCGTDTVITVGPMLDHLGYAPDVENLIRMDQMDFKSMPDLRWPHAPDDDDLAVLLYTSGTSGKPKGVMLSHWNIQANIEQCRRWASVGRTDCALGVLPQFHSFGMTVLTLLPLTVGFKAVYTARFIPGKIVKLFREHQPSIFVGIPSMYNALLHAKDARPEDFSNVKYLVSGGEPLPEAVFNGFKERFSVTINEGYGLTETSPVTNWCRPHEFRRRSVGRPITGVEQIIVDIESGAALGPNRDGEVRMRGPNVMQGYFNRPEETAKVFDHQGYFRTGDIGRLDDEGHLYITGRLKEMLIIGGENVFPREIEEVLNAHPAIKESGVVGKADPIRGELPVAFVELKEGQSLDERSVRAFCRERLAGYKVPNEIKVLEALPRNPTGKVMRRELKKMVGTTVF